MPRLHGGKTCVTMSYRDYEVYGITLGIMEKNMETTAMGAYIGFGVQGHRIQGYEAKVMSESRVCHSSGSCPQSQLLSSLCPKHF